MNDRKIAECSYLCTFNISIRWEGNSEKVLSFVRLKILNSINNWYFTGVALSIMMCLSNVLLTASSLWAKSCTSLYRRENWHLYYCYIHRFFVFVVTDKSSLPEDLFNFRGVFISLSNVAHIINYSILSHWENFIYVYITRNLFPEKAESLPYQNRGVSLFSSNFNLTKFCLDSLKFSSTFSGFAYLWLNWNLFIFSAECTTPAPA